MEIKSIGVIGAGQMGSGIAQVAAQFSIDVQLLDLNAAAAERGRDRIAAGLDARVKRGKLDAAERDAIVSHIHAAANYDALAMVEIVIEAAEENVQVKCDVFRRADAAAQAARVLATNTSAIPITKLASTVSRPHQVIGMHFMNPAPVMRLVEIIRALQTDDATSETAHQFAAQLDKEVISAGDMPGFIVNRMLIPFLNEACFALQEGLGKPEDIDRGAQLGLNHPMGPLQLADLIGLDTVLYMAEVLHRELGEDKYRPPTILRNHVAAGWLGRKTGRGFYKYK